MRALRLSASFLNVTMLVALSLSRSGSNASIKPSFVVVVVQLITDADLKFSDLSACVQDKSKMYHRVLMKFTQN